MTTTYVFTFASGETLSIYTNEPPRALEPIGGLWKISDRDNHIRIINWHLVNHAEVVTFT